MSYVGQKSISSTLHYGQLKKMRIPSLYFQCLDNWYVRKDRFKKNYHRYTSANKLVKNIIFKLPYQVNDGDSHG